MQTILLTGSNQGNRLENMISALKMIAGNGKILKTSPLYETEPWGFDHPVPFLNQAILLNTPLPPLQLLGKLQHIEKILGRHRLANGYSARTMDIDILFYGQEIINTSGLTVPHPMLHQRRFVLVPVARICPDWRHPVLSLTLEKLLESCTDEKEVKIFKEE